jgi:ketosteroid isomerase-like protein
MPKEIRAFFETYRDAFNALDGAAVAHLYAEPSAIAQDREFTHWPTRALVQENMVKLCELYRQRGYVAATFTEGAFVAQGTDYAIVDLQWRIEWRAGQEPWTFNTTYNLVRTEQGWRVLVCTAYSESAHFKPNAG